eukprot:CAMPEP_0114355988 /NCGR_PEP_ID=MMETSP0101-20121206/20634_1 /TAXON_ID=38822 ORGANISM="Pteridomonas danica, Strain PT" /NCGR_SAMPLE_ID=MMETSP0101 /ASSEMBLY_ACC=CAM_ASM_000211 /LENGTH=43 /DNA_ID= /DNA_START= /DNA_END= /DNA_ORIENTATION=
MILSISCFDENFEFRRRLVIGEKEEDDGDDDDGSGDDVDGEDN